ncbi:MAG: MTH1187 family thiamine-binding protein [Desulfobulbaceae bacterium]|nr:MTH1187 family thiamine-binding protein [Desulfobulbaceae bacterium]MCK5544290.1 MTH1187 family thiamine-binding protein [Desulfobulbaceae bacterium]
MALMQLTVIPLGTSSPSLGDYVADIQNRLEQENVNFELNDMGTIVQGETPELLALAARISELPFQKGVNRVVTHITIDDRRDKQVTIGTKIASVKARL